MKTLHLNLKKKWFDMILSGEKREEYREIKSYFKSRLCDSYTKDSSCIDANCLTCFFHPLSFNKYYSITFSNGYAKDRRQFEIKLGGIDIGTGLPKWGAERYKKYFVLRLGKIISKKNS